MSPETHEPAAADRPNLDEEEARALGRSAGSFFDLRLRQHEGRQREERLSEVAWFGQADRGSVGADSYEVAKLRSQVEETTAYLRAIENSIAWRATQWLRGLFGRAW